MEFGNYILLAIPLGSFLVAFFLFPSFIKILERRNLLDVSDHRKVHERNVPGMGGVIIILATSLTIPFFFPISELVEFRYFLGGLVLIFIVGLRDDMVPLTAFLKLVSQLVPVLIVIFLSDIRITSLYTLGSLDFQPTIQVMLTAFTMILIINSINLVDGIDGLAGSLSSLSLVTFAVVFFLTGQVYFAYILLALTGAILGFLIFNWSPARIFMGDNGALLIGFALACSAVLFLNNNSEPSHTRFTGTVATSISFLAIPLFDMFRIIVFRLRTRRGLFTADRNHLHHLLLRLGLTHGKAALLLFTLQSAIILNAYLMRAYNDWLILMELAIIMFGFNGLILFLIRRKSETQESGV